MKITLINIINLFLKLVKKIIYLFRKRKIEDTTLDMLETAEKITIDKENKDRVDYTLASTRATVEEGIVANNEELHISLMSCEIPYSFYNISSDLKNNTFYYAETLLTFTNQDYSIDDVVDFFNNDTGFSAKFTTTYDRQKNKIKFTNISASSQILQFVNSTINKVIGYDDTGKQSDVTVASGSYSESPFVCNLATVHSLLIKANIGQANVLSTISGNSSILQKVSRCKYKWYNIFKSTGF